MAKSERSAKAVPSLHGDATIIYGGGTAVLPNVDIAGANRLALVGVEAAGEEGENVARDGKEDMKSILGGAYARVLEGGLLVVGRGHEGRQARGDRMETLVAVGRGGPYNGQARDKKRFRALRSLYLTFQKGFCIERMIKFEADPVVGQAKGSALRWGKHTPRINKVAPKSPQRRVLLVFLRYLNTLAVDPMRRSLRALWSGQPCHVFKP